jgi:LCP family protein required for cell wall assembly
MGEERFSLTDLEEQFWGYKKSKNNKELSKEGERNAKYYLALLFCMALFLWTGFQLSFIFPLEETEARPDQENVTTEVPAEDQEDDKQIILVLGGDNRKGEPGRTDTILLVFLDPKEKTVNVLNIPRDTYVKIAGKGFKTKINHAFAYGGVDMAKNTVEEFLDIKIDHYVDTDFDGFASLIDALGGITVDVEKRMYYPAENIDLKKGVQKLNGEQALGYVRFRSDGLGDLGRVERQQKFLPILADRILSLSTLWKIPKLVGIFQENVDTDLSLREMISLANSFKSFDVSKLKTSMLPGTPEYINGVSYYISDPVETAKLIDELKSGKILEETESEEETES